jgi:hypothetical protein
MSDINENSLETIEIEIPHQGPPILDPVREEWHRGHLEYQRQRWADKHEQEMEIMRHEIEVLRGPLAYTHLPIGCDLTCATLEWAMGQLDTPIYLHVHPSRVSSAREIVARTPHAMEFRVIPTEVSDDTLAINEWYLVTSIGSRPPE